MKTEKQIKSLQERISKMKDEIVSLQREQTLTKQMIGKRSQELNTLKQNLANLMRKKECLMVTDHAIVRYLERVRGLNIQQVKDEILTDHAIGLIEKLGTNGEYPTGNGFSIVLRERNVVTIKD